VLTSRIRCLFTFIRPFVCIWVRFSLTGGALNTIAERHTKNKVIVFNKLYYYYYTRFIMHVRSFTTWRISSADKVTCQWRNERLYRAVSSLDLKVSVDTVESEITVSDRLFQIVGEAWQKTLVEKLRTAGLYCRMLAPRGRSCLGSLVETNEFWQILRLLNCRGFVSEQCDFVFNLVTDRKPV